jgi:hypothetical protein
LNRLIKELRLEGIDTIEDADDYLPTFMEQFAVTEDSEYRCQDTTL